MLYIFHTGQPSCTDYLRIPQDQEAIPQKSANQVNEVNAVGINLINPKNPE